MCEEKAVLSSRVRLARNFADLPFRSRMNSEQADACIDRVLSVLRDEEDTYRYYPMRGLDETRRRQLVEDHLISADLFASDDQGAALIREDGGVSVMVNEEDHLRIQGFASGLNLPAAAERAFQVEEALAGREKFAFDREWGYLTACPTNTGTGMRASVMLHLPMLTLLKQMGKVTQLAAKLGLTLWGIYGEGSQALGFVYQLSNQITLGRTEKEILEATGAVARQIAEMEQTCREKAAEKDPVAFEDQLRRSYGLMRYARKMGMREFYSHWSNLRLGAAMGKLPLDTAACDQLLEKAQRAHLQMAAGRKLTDREADESRSALLEKTLTGADGDGACENGR